MKAKDRHFIEEIRSKSCLCTNSKEFEEDYIVIAVDSKGIKVTDRGQWMREKWNVG